MKIDAKFLRRHFGAVRSGDVIEDLEDMYRDAKRISHEHGHHTLYVIYMCGLGCTPQDSHEVCLLDSTGKGLIPVESYAKRFGMLANQASFFMLDCGRLLMTDIRQYAAHPRVKGYSEHTKVGHTYVKFACLTNQRPGEEGKVVKFKDDRFSKGIQEISLQIHNEEALQFKQLVDKLSNCHCFGKPCEFEWLLFRDIKMKLNIY
jgi:hypothetical protein